MTLFTILLRIQNILEIIQAAGLARRLSLKRLRGVSCCGRELQGQPVGRNFNLTFHSRGFNHASAQNVFFLLHKLKNNAIKNGNKKAT